MIKCRKKSILSILFIFLLTTLTGCLSPAAPAPVTTTVPTAQALASSPLSSATPLPSIAEAVAEVYPSVVTITTESTSYSLFSGSRVQTGAGSGWVFSEDGIIVTNNHVVEGASKVIVGLSDGRTFTAEKIFRDPVTDLAVVKINVTGLSPARVGDSSALRVGDWVVAVGNPLGQGLRAKEGTISGLKVSLTVGNSETLYDLIETSAAINPGNSGGPLVNIVGEVIGITSVKIATTGVEGMGYAISTREAIPIIEQLTAGGYVQRAWLGAEFITVDRYVAAVNRLPLDKGAVVSQITQGSPAYTAGLQVRDIITRFQGKEVTTAEGLTQGINSCQIGQEVEVTYVRNNETRTTSIRLGESPPL